MVTVIMAAIVVIGTNFLIMGYLRIQPPATSAYSPLTPWGSIQALEGPIDNLLMGDSACGVDVSTGPISDRLGGSSINLGNNAQASLIMEAWQLAYYIERFGPPRNVILTLSSPVGYNMPHTVEFMAAVPLSWGYWDKLGITPAWNPGEEWSLIFNKYFVLNSYADILRERFLFFWDMFKHPARLNYVGKYYNPGSTAPQVEMEAGKKFRIIISLIFPPV